MKNAFFSNGILILQIAFLYIVFPANSMAFSCKSMNEAELLEYSDAVVIGKILDVKNIDYSPTSEARTYISSILKVRVLKALKGVNEGEKIIVHKEHNYITLDAPKKFKKGESYYFPLKKYSMLDSKQNFVLGLCHYEHLMKQ